jgi:glycosyltransferase involved in cell wall biosynthesis
MVRIAAVVHTYNDALRLGRCLETVYPCDEIVVVDHGSQDRTLQVAREYGARAIVATGGDKKFWQPSDAEWILCLDPRESLTESLAASLFEWKAGAAGDVFSVFLREETSGGWIENRAAQTRLVPANWSRWQGHFPATEPSAVVLEGELLRFAA